MAQCRTASASRPSSRRRPSSSAGRAHRHYAPRPILTLVRSDPPPLLRLKVSDSSDCPPAASGHHSHRPPLRLPRPRALIGSLASVWREGLFLVRCSVFAAVLSVAAALSWYAQLRARNSQRSSLHSDNKMLLACNRLEDLQHGKGNLYQGHVLEEFESLSEDNIGVQQESILGNFGSCTFAYNWASFWPFQLKGSRISFNAPYASLGVEIQKLKPRFAIGLGDPSWWGSEYTPHHTRFCLFQWRELDAFGIW